MFYQWATLTPLFSVCVTEHYMKPYRMKWHNFFQFSASNASSLGETSLLASRTSSFQRGTDSTRLATSPLVNPPQSPQLGSRTVVATALESKFFIELVLGFIYIRFLLKGKVRVVSFYEPPSFQGLPNSHIKPNCNFPISRGNVSI